jgi:hypothetical protein
LKKLVCLLLLGLSACQAFTRPDTPATLRAENAGFLVEATSIAETAQADVERVRGTAEAAETIIARTDSVNQQLRATARVVIPPTPLIAGGAGAVGTPDASGMQFTDLGTTATVRDSDGCANGLQSQFPADTQRIYVTARAVNMKAGTLMGVQWNYDGQPSFSESFVVPIDDDDYCLWFNLDPVAGTFSTGSWSVRLLANETPIEPEVIFTIG